MRKKFFPTESEGSGNGDSDELEVQNEDPTNPYIASGGAKARRDNKINDSVISSQMSSIESATRLKEGKGNMYDKDD